MKYIVLSAFFLIAAYLLLTPQPSPMPKLVMDNRLIFFLPRYARLCELSVTLFKHDGHGGWKVLPTDAVPAGRYNARVLDGKRMADGMCDVHECTRVGDIDKIDLVDTIRNGTAILPNDGGSEELPSYRTEVLKGTIKVDVPYYADSGCKTPASLSFIIHN